MFHIRTPNLENEFFSYPRREDIIGTLRYNDADVTKADRK